MKTFKMVCILSISLLVTQIIEVRAQNPEECAPAPSLLEDLSGQSCSAAVKIQDDIDDEIIKEKKEFKDTLPRKVRKEFKEIEKTSEENIKNYELEITEKKESIEASNKIISEQRAKIAKTSDEEKIKLYQEKIAKKEASIQKAQAEIEKLQNLIIDEKKLIENIEDRSIELANRIKANDCKGLLHRVRIDTDIDVKLDVPKLNKVDPEKTYTSKEKKEMERTLGEFETSEEAQAFRQKLLLDNLHFTSCVVTPKEITITQDKPIITYANKVLDKVSGAGDSFVDNGKGLSTTSTKDLDESILGWKDILDTKKDNLGRSVERQITKVKIYTCASTYRNCSPLGKDERTPDQDSCQMIDLLRKYTVSDIMGALDFVPKGEKKLKESSKAAYFSSEFKQLNEEDKPFLKSVLSSKTFKDALKNVYTEADEAKNPELKLWIALSAMRAESMKNKIRADLKEKSGVDLTDDMFEIIPTGHPNDPFNNSKIDPSLSGTCGPLPQSKDSFYGQCLTKNSSACEQQKPQCNKLKKFYNQPDIMASREELLKIYVGSDYQTKSAEDQYSIHRYYQVEPEFIEKVTESSQEEVTKKRFIVSCKKMDFNCYKLDITPDINIDWNFNSPRPRVYMPKGVNGSTACPRF